jgi:microcystin-dependent protein
MAIVATPRVYCFAAGFTNRFKNNDKPDEVFFKDFTDTITFKSDPNDTASKTMAGLCKTTTDAKVNQRLDGDESPYAGFATFVRPSQLANITAGAGIVVTPTLRSPNNNGLGTNGEGIYDLQISSPLVVPIDTDDLLMAKDYLVRRTTGIVPALNTVDDLVDADPPSLPPNPLTVLLDKIVAELNTTQTQLKELALLYKDERLNIADVVQTVEQPANWSSKWLPCDGREIQQSAYPALFAIIGNSFGVAATPGYFRLPNYRNKFLRGYNSNIGVPSSLSGSDTASISIGVVNLPAHKHSITNLNTTSNGGHSHNITTGRHSTNSGGIVESTDVSISGSGAQTGSTPDHQHTVSGDTNDTGGGQNIIVDTVPSHFPIYFKIKVL